MTKTFKQLLIVLITLSICFNAQAKRDSLAKAQRKYNTSIIISASNFSVIGLTPFYYKLLLPPRYFSGNVANQPGIYAERQIGDNMRIGLGYSGWNINPYLNRFYDWGDPEELDPDIRYIPGQKHNNDIGSFRYRYGYKMIDAVLNYRYDKFKHHKFTVGLGLSYTWGTNYYIVTKYFDYSGNFEVTVTRTEPHNYTGIILPLRYDYLFLRHRLSIGAQGTLRKYIGLYSFQVDYGLHIAVNF